MVNISPWEEVTFGVVRSLESKKYKGKIQMFKMENWLSSRPYFKLNKIGILRTV
jgi:hypothetical protein